MEARLSKHLHEEIGITFRELGALLGARNMLAAGLVEHSYQANTESRIAWAKMEKGAHLFDMNTGHRHFGCGTMGCIGGLMGLIMGDNTSNYVATKARVWSHEARMWSHEECPLTRLFYPQSTAADWQAITPAQAVKAIDQFLNTKGKKAWEGIVD